jgi:hypothetical protein
LPGIGNKPSESKRDTNENRYTDPKKLDISNEEWLRMLMETDLHFISY